MLKRGGLLRGCEPAGQEIHVPRTMCARLNDWLVEIQRALIVSLATPICLSPVVVLCYRECPDDEVPRSP